MDFDFLIKVVLVGDASVGKSSLLLRYADNTYVGQSMPTIGVDFKIKTLTVDGQTVKLQIWDTAGQEKFRNITTSYYRGANGIILIYDIASERSFQSVSSWLQEVNRYLGHKSDVRKLLIGNKADLEHERQVSTEQGKAFAEANGLPFLEASAKKDINVEQMFRSLAEAAVRRSSSAMPRLEPAARTDVVRLHAGDSTHQTAARGASCSSC